MRAVGWIRLKITALEWSSCCEAIWILASIRTIQNLNLSVNTKLIKIQKLRKNGKWHATSFFILFCNSSVAQMEFISNKLKYCLQTQGRAILHLCILETTLTWKQRFLLHKCWQWVTACLCTGWDSNSSSWPKKCRSTLDFQLHLLSCQLSSLHNVDGMCACHCAPCSQSPSHLISQFLIWPFFA